MSCSIVDGLAEGVGCADDTSARIQRFAYVERRVVGEFLLAHANVWFVATVGTLAPRVRVFGLAVTVAQVFAGQLAVVVNHRIREVLEVTLALTARSQRRHALLDAPGNVRDALAWIQRLRIAHI